MSRVAALALCAVAGLLLTGASADDASPALAGTIQISVGAACGGLAVLLVNLHRHAARTEARHVEQEGRMRELADTIRELEHKLEAVLALLRRDLP